MPSTFVSLLKINELNLLSKISIAYLRDKSSFFTFFKLKRKRRDQFTWTEFVLSEILLFRLVG